MKTGDNWKGWTIEELLGEGAFGQVFKISRVEMGNKYYSALKVINIPNSSGEYSALKNQGMNDSDINRYFRDIAEDFSVELRMMDELKGHSNIVSYENHLIEKKTDGIGWTIYIQMELLTSLLKYSKENRLSENDIIKLGVDMCEALEACRKMNIIHRDIKPANIFVSRFGDYKLGDFGIARKLEQTQSGLSIKGTYSYMAPEVYLGKPYNHTVDICSLGLVLYVMLNNGRSPFLPPPPAPIRYTDHDTALMKRISGEPLPIPANASAELAAVVLKACAFDPADRYQSPREFEDALLSVGNNGAHNITNTIAADSIPEKKSGKKLLVALLCVALALLIVLLAVVNIDFRQPTAETAAVQTTVEATTTQPAATASTTAEPTTAAPTENPLLDPDSGDIAAKIDASSREERTFSVNKDQFAFIDKTGKAHRFEIKSSSVTEVPYDIEDNDNLAAIEYSQFGSGVGFGIKKDGSVILLSKGETEFDYEQILPQLKNVDDIVSHERESTNEDGKTVRRAVVCGLHKDGTVIALRLSDDESAKRFIGYDSWRDIKSISLYLGAPAGLKTDHTIIINKSDKQKQYTKITGIAAMQQGSLLYDNDVYLKTDGTITVPKNGNFWYSDGMEKASKWKDIIGFCTGGSFIIGLKKDGTAAFVGTNKNGQCNVSGWSDVIALQTCNDYTVGKKSDGKFVIATNNYELQKSFEEAVNKVIK